MAQEVDGPSSTHRQVQHHHQTDQIPEEVARSDHRRHVGEAHWQEFPQEQQVQPPVVRKGHARLHLGQVDSRHPGQIGLQQLPAVGEEARVQVIMDLSS